MAITKLQADAKGTAGNSTGADVKDAVNALIDNSSYQFDTVALMKASADLVSGDIVETLGYATKGDAGKGTYTVKTAAEATTDGDIIDEFGNHSGASSLKLVLQKGREVLVEQFGAGLGLGDDTPRITASVAFADTGTSFDSAKEITPIRGYSKNYALNTSLTIGSSVAPSIIDLELMGTFTTLSTLTVAIKLKHLKSSQVKLGRINPVVNALNTGVVIENCFGGDINIAEIGGYETAVNYHGDGSYGFQGNAYTRVKCSQAGRTVHTKVVVLLSTSNIGYNNSTNVEVTSARGDVFSRHIKGTGQIDPYNQNMYRNCGLEDIKQTGFEWEFTSFSNVIKPRLESPNGTTRFIDGVINESSDCAGNTFDLHTCKSALIGVIGDESIVNAQILNSSGAVEANQVVQTRDGRFFHTDYAGASIANNLTIFTAGDTTATSKDNPLSKYRGFFKDATGHVHPYGLGSPYGVKRITTYTANDIISLDFATTVDITTDSGALDLRSHTDRQMEGFEIILNLRQPMTALTFSHADGSLPIAATAFSTAGVYLIKRIDYRWRVTKIGDQFAIS